MQGHSGFSHETPEPFKAGACVRVTAAHSPFYAWTGTIIEPLQPQALSPQRYEIDLSPAEGGQSLSLTFAHGDLEELK